MLFHIKSNNKRILEVCFSLKNWPQLTFWKRYLLPSSPPSPPVHPPPPQFTPLPPQFTPLPCPRRLSREVKYTEYIGHLYCTKSVCVALSTVRKPDLCTNKGGGRGKLCTRAGRPVFTDDQETQHLPRLAYFINFFRFLSRYYGGAGN